MNCNVIKDLIPLYIDGCCSADSKKHVEEHIKNCEDCKKLVEDMSSPSDIIAVPALPKTFSKLNAWKASVLQSILLVISFTLITIGVTLEARTPSGIANSFWALNLVVPATGFMLSLANWYFVRVYKNRKSFSNCSFVATLGVTFCAYICSIFHYEINLFDLFAWNAYANNLEILCSLILLNGIGILLSIIFCALSKILSNQYAKMLGKE